MVIINNRVSINTIEYLLRDNNTYMATTYDAELDQNIEHLIIESEINNIPVTAIFINEPTWQLKTLTIPEYAKSVDTELPSSTTIYVHEKNPNFITDGKALFSKDGKVLEKFLIHGLTSYEIPQGVEIISELAFAFMCNLKEVTIPNSVTILENRAFLNCANLETIYGAKNVINASLFSFDGTKLFQDLKFRTIGKVLVRARVQDDNEFMIPLHVQTIGSYAFSFPLEKEKSITLGPNITHICTHAFHNSNVEEIYMTNVVYIEDWAFNICRHLRRLEMSDTVEFIGGKSLNLCNQLEEIRLSNRLKEFPDNLFSDAPQIKKIHIPDNLQSYSPLSMPNTTSRFSHPFPELFEEFTISTEHDYFTVSDGVLFTKDMRVLLRMPKQLQLKSARYIVPNTVEEIAAFAFNDCSSLQSVKMGNQVKKIGKYAFSFCSNLKTVTLSNNIEVLEEGTFVNCSKLERVSHPTALKHIGDQAYAYTNLKNPTIPKNVKTVGLGVFTNNREKNIIIYNTLDPDGPDADSQVDIQNGKANSTIGWLSKPSLFNGHARVMIFVKDAKTDAILYKMFIPDDDSRLIYNRIASSWGKNGTFYFKGMDQNFEGFNRGHNKLRYALLRLRYPVDLSDRTKQNYEEYVKRTSTRILKHSIEKEIIDILEDALYLNMITKANKTKLADHARMLVATKRRKKVYKQVIALLEER